MSEETQEEGTWSSLKKTVIGVLSTAVIAVGTWATSLLGGGDAAPAAAPAPVINITNSNQQAQQASGGGTKVIERVVEKPAAQPAAPSPKPKKKEGDEFKEEAPKW